MPRLGTSPAEVLRLRAPNFSSEAADARRANGIGPIRLALWIPLLAALGVTLVWAPWLTIVLVASGLSAPALLSHKWSSHWLLWAGSVAVTGTLAVATVATHNLLPLAAPKALLIASSTASAVLWVAQGRRWADHVVVMSSVVALYVGAQSALVGNRGFGFVLVLFTLPLILAGAALGAASGGLPRQLATGLLACAALVAVLKLYQVGGFRTSHIEIGRLLATGLVLAATSRGLPTLMRVSGSVFLFAAAYASGSRSAILMPLLALGIVYGIALVSGKRSWVKILATFLLFGVVLQLHLISPEALLQDRLGSSGDPISAKRQIGAFSLSTLLHSESAHVREHSTYAVAWSQFISHPLTGVGMGVGVAGAGLRYEYAHNMYLELWSGAGLIGVAISGLVTVAVWYGIMGCIRRENYALAALVLLWFLFAQVSGDLNVNRPLFLFCTMACCAINSGTADGTAKANPPGASPAVRPLAGSPGASARRFRVDIPRLFGS